MKEFVARSSSDSEFDSNCLFNILESLINEISIPILERRVRSKSLKKNPIEELSNLISELTNCELDLHTCVKISVTTNVQKLKNPKQKPNT